MKEKTDILVVGGGPAGMVCALTARRYYPEKRVMLIKSVDKGVVPCGIPYMFSSLPHPEDNAVGTKPLEAKGIKVLVDEVTRVDRSEKIIHTRRGDMYGYEKLVLALGSSPIIPPIGGIGKEGIHPVRKDLTYLQRVVEEIGKLKKVLIVGGGFIGIEFADELAHREGMEVILVEKLPHLLSNSFDREFSELAEEKLEAGGVRIITSTEVAEFIGEGRVKKVRFSDGEEIEVGGVVLGIGAVPNLDLARGADLVLAGQKGIWVDEYMRTIDPDIFAIGDCAVKRDFYTRKETTVMLASTATAEARIAGANLYKLKVIRENKGTIAIFSTYIDGLVLGSAGLTETSAAREGFEIITGVVEGKDKHPGSLPEASDLKIKLIFSRNSGIIMGGQVAGGVSCGEIINIIGMAIQKRDSLTEMETLQMATHPRLTSAPTRYPLVLAAQAAAGKMCR
jgi:NADPH-dependent 2,4-dienoyl-CoA reductase/sulfur reductase-like enzyme